MNNKIKILRLKAGLTQEDLARASNIRRETIVHLEQGKYNPSLKLAFAISSALNSTIEKVFIFSKEDLP